MPTYSFECKACLAILDKFMKMSDPHPTICPSCASESLSQVILDTPMMVIPGNCTHDGITKVVGTSNRNQKLNVPINIIDDLPGGGKRVTRIGSKRDIENE